MINYTWFDNAASSDWVRLGEFRLKGLLGFLGSDLVTFYATFSEFVPDALQLLENWVSGLHPKTYFVYSDGVK